VVETRAAKYSAANKDKAAQQESVQILKALEKKRGVVVVLDLSGRQMSSEELAAFIKNRQDMGMAAFDFVIGGAYGFSPEVIKKADLLLSLSKMTFTHEMARLILVEQLYRAASINVGSPYHH